MVNAFRQTGATTKMIQSLPMFIRDISSPSGYVGYESEPSVLIVAYDSNQINVLKDEITRHRGASYVKKFVRFYNVKSEGWTCGSSIPRFNVFVDQAVWQCATDKEIETAWAAIMPCLK
jgi:hypothetical protein